MEAGFLEAHGTGRSRSYTLSSQLYREAGQSAEYIRQAGFAPLQQEQMVLAYIDTHGSNWGRVWILMAEYVGARHAVPTKLTGNNNLLVGL